MGLRDDEEALRAKVDGLERELSDVRAELQQAKAKAPTKPTPGPIERAIDGLERLRLRAIRFVTIPSQRWSLPRSLGFAAVMAALIAVSVTGGLFFVPTVQHDIRPVDVVFMGWMLLVVPAVTFGAAYALGARSPRAATLASCAVIWVGLLVNLWVPVLTDAPRILLFGTTSGTLEAVAATDAGWAEISPAYLDVSHIGTGVSTRMENGRMVSSSDSAAPLVPSWPYSGPVSLFVCDDDEDLIAMGAGTGVIAGRIEPASGLVREAVAATGLPMGANPRCVTPTLGDGPTTLRIGGAVLALYVSLLTALGAWGVTKVAASEG